MQRSSYTTKVVLSGTMRLLRAWLIVLFAGWLTACAGVKFVADYDAEAVKSITNTSAEVFAFYDKLKEAKAKAGSEKLQYAGHAEDWGRIESQIRVLVVREEARPLNSESQRMATLLLTLWERYRASHRSTNDYATSEIIRHRDLLQRLFVAALVAEKAKALATEAGGAPNN